jgi:hypothetical protein
LAQGNSNVELDSIMTFADFNREPIAHFQCNIENPAAKAN